MALLETKDLTMQFGGLKAVDDFEISVDKDELVGLIGPNGAGKTTIFNMLTGVYTPTKGSIHIGGKNAVGKTPYQIVKLGGARTFQNIRLFKDLPVIDNIKIAYHHEVDYNILNGVFRTKKFWQGEKKAYENSIDFLKIFEMEDYADTLAKNLPYGKQRKLEIARALATKPKILMLDEPAAGMNPQETKELMETIHFIKDKFDIAILLIEHDMNLVMGVCERIVVIDYGKIIAKGTPDEIKNNPDAIKQLSFHVNEGEIVTLIGANGAGKTTTLKTISRILDPTHGIIKYRDEDMLKIHPHQIIDLGIAHVPEGRRIFSKMTVSENLQMGAFIRKDKREIQDDLSMVFKRFPRLKERYKQIAGTLSGGEQQMLAIGRALMSRPKMILMDEPSMGLAPILVEQIFDIINTINNAGTTILLVEQNAKQALEVADRGYVLETGKIIAEGTGKELLQDEKVKEAYLGG